MFGPRSSLARLATICAALPLFLSACTSGGSADALSALSTPRATAEAFVEAFNSADEEAFAKTLTVKARPAFTSGNAFSLSNETLEQVTIGTVTETGTDASVPVTAISDGSEKTVTLHQRLEEGQWRIYAFETETPGGSFKLDLEQIGAFADQMASQMGSAIQESFEEARREQEARERATRRQTFDRLAAISESEFSGGWMVEEDLRGRPMREVLVTLCRELGFPIRFGDSLSRFDGPLTADLLGISRAEAIDRILASVGCFAEFPRAFELASQPDVTPGAVQSNPESLPGYSSATDVEPYDASIYPAALVVKVGEAPGAITYAGPVRVSVDAIEQFPEYGTGEVDVAVRILGLEPGVCVATSAQTRVVDFTEVVDGDGTELRADPNVQYLGAGNPGRNSVESTYSLDLRDLFSSVSAIERIAGEVNVAIPTRVETLRFADATKGDKGTVGEFTYEIQTVGNSWTLAFRGEAEALKKLTVYGVPKNAAGEDLNVQFESTSAWGGGESQYQIQCSSPIASIEMRCLLATETITSNFSLEETPLPRWQDAPASLPSLQFSTPQPVTVRFIELLEAGTDFPKAKVEITNHSNKDLESIGCNFIYRDASGKTLEDFPHTLNGMNGFDGPKAFVSRGGSTTHEATAFFVAPGTKSVEIVVESVQFLDASLWERKK